MSRISWIPTVLFIVAMPLFLVTASVSWAFNNPGVYQRGFEQYHVSSITGITEADLEQASNAGPLPPLGGGGCCGGGCGCGH